MSEVQFASALDGITAPQGLVIGLSEITDRGMIDLRGNPSRRAFLSAVKKVPGVDLPRQPRTSCTSGDITVLWLSVDQWLVCCPRAKARGLTAALGDALKAQHAMVTDMSDARTIIRLSGDGAREVLCKGTPVDLTLPEFGKGCVRRVRFGEIAALIHIRGTTPDDIDLYVFRSYAHHAWDWLCVTARTRARVRLFGDQTPG